MLAIIELFLRDTHDRCIMRSFVYLKTNHKTIVFSRVDCHLLSINRSDGVVDGASASEAVDAGSIPVSGQAEDFRKLAFTASLLGVQH